MSGFKRIAIRKILDRQLKCWLNSIEDEQIRKIAAENVIVSGGAIASMLEGKSPNDYDLYFRTKEATQAIAQFYVDRFIVESDWANKQSVNDYVPVVKKRIVRNILGETEDRLVIWMQSAGVASEAQCEYKYVEYTGDESFTDSLKEEKKGKKPPYRPVFLSDNAITLSNNFQLVIRFFGEPTEIHRNYDFIHCMHYYDYEKRDLYLNPRGVEAVLSKSLVYEGSLYPLASLFRIRKFLARGYRITAGQMLKPVMQLNDVDLQDLKVLQEQLIGVDMAYMRELITRLEDTEPEKIDTIYIMSLIDEIFE